VKRRLGRTLVKLGARLLQSEPTSSLTTNAKVTIHYTGTGLDPVEDVRRWTVKHRMGQTG
jgi:hypothetical protein